MGQNGSMVPVYTKAATLDEIRNWEVQSLQMIAEAHKAKRALDILASHGLISTPRMFWDGTGDLATYIINKDEEMKVKCL